jgi:hypothetical protein
MYFAKNSSPANISGNHAFEGDVSNDTLTKLALK